MPRRNRCVLPGIPCHITQRGVDRRETFSSPHDRLTYLRLVKENLEDSQVRILAYCLMTNHIHLIAVPARENSLAVLLCRVHGRYAQYYNTGYGRAAHLWQNRFFACALQQDHLPAAPSYVDRNPVRAPSYGIRATIGRAPRRTSPALIERESWIWTGARDPAALGGNHRQQRPEMPTHRRGAARIRATRSATTAFVDELSRRFGRYRTRGRPPKQRLAVGDTSADQYSLFAE